MEDVKAPLRDAPIGALRVQIVVQLAGLVSEHGPQKPEGEARGTQLPEGDPDLTVSDFFIEEVG